MRVEDIVVGNEVMLLKDIEEVQLAFRPAKGELRKRRVVVYDSSMKHYIGQRGIVLRKDGEGVTQVQYKDSTTYWFPPEALRPSLLTISRFTPFHHFPLSESDLEDAEIGIWRCSHCLRISNQAKDIGKPWICLGGTPFKLCNVCVFSVDSDEARSIFNACEKGNLSLLEELVNLEGKDVNALKPVSTWTPLHYACRHGHLTICEFLLRHGANPDFRDIDGRAPIHLATEFNHSKCALLLMDCGAKYWLMNKWGKDPYILAMERGNEIIARAVQKLRNEKKRLHELEFGVPSDEELYSDEDADDSEVEDETEAVKAQALKNRELSNDNEGKKTGKKKGGLFSRFSRS